MNRMADAVWDIGRRITLELELVVEFGELQLL